MLFMASFFLRKQESALGPIPFADLVDMVRSGEVTANDKVREYHQIHWQYAAEVIGLFHMANRQQALKEFEEAQRNAVAENVNNPPSLSEFSEMSSLDIDAMLEVANVVAAQEEVTAWMLRLRQMEEERRKVPNDAAENDHDDGLSQIRNAKFAAIQEAVSNIKRGNIPRRGLRTASIVLTTVAMIATTIWLTFHRSTPTQNEMHARFVAILDRFPQDSNSTTTPTDDTAFRADSIRFVRSITPALEECAHADDPPSLSALWIARDYLPVLLSESTSEEQRSLMLTKTTQHLRIIQDSLDESAKAESKRSSHYAAMATYGLAVVDMAVAVMIVRLIWMRNTRPLKSGSASEAATNRVPT